MSTNQLLTSALLKELNTVLRAHGFRRSGQRFARELPEVVHLVEVQKSVSSTSSEARVTINLGVWLPFLAPTRAGQRDRPHVSGAHWRQRLGFFLPERRDTWWVLSDADHARAVGPQIVSAVVTYGLPALDRVSGVKDLLNQWRAGAGPGLTERQREAYLARLEGYLHAQGAAT